MLKEVIVLIRPDKLWPSLDLLEANGVDLITRSRVLGRGRQGGLKAGGGLHIGLLPKWQLNFLALDSQVDALVAGLIEINQSGQMGDGKIFVCPVEREAGVAMETIS